MKRFLPATILVATIVVSAPFMGVIRDLLFDRFEAAAVRYLAFALLALAAAVFLYAVTRIRRHRLLRYAGLAFAAFLLWLQETVLSAGISEPGLAARVSVAEKIHLVEYGLLAFLLYRAFLRYLGRSSDLSILLLPLLWLTTAGVLEESMQWLVETRLGEIRDVFLNVYAGVCGWLFSLALDPPESFAWRLDGNGRRRVADAAALATLALGLFFGFAHLGFEHFDPEIGSFRSWHSLEQLRLAATDRALRWQRDPPTELSPWRREDFYLTEAGWQATHRNERYRAGDLYLAAQANRILEKYYAPFLDLESFRGSGRHRYPPEVRQDLENRAPRHDPERYLSPVLIDRLYPWPSKRLLLAGLFPVVLGIWLLPRVFGRVS